MLLNYLDSAIGFIVVILMFSLLITVLVQMIGVLLQLRGKSLLRGVELLLREVDPQIKTQAKELADQVLTHPVIAEGKDRLASALRPSELKLVLQSLAEENPKLKAVLDQKEEEVFARLDAWFEPVMDRARERFKMSTRWATTVFAVLVAFALQLDSISLFRQISTNGELRARLVAMSDSVLQTSQKVLDAPATPAAEQGLAQVEALKAQADEIKSQIESTQLQVVPNPWRLSAFESTRSFLGLILTMFLLGLGAPFWFNALRNLVGLRHAVDKKEADQEEAERSAAAGR